MDILTIKTKTKEGEEEKTYSFSIFGALVLSFILGGISVNYIALSRGNKKG